MFLFNLRTSAVASHPIYYVDISICLARAYVHTTVRTMYI